MRLSLRGFRTQNHRSERGFTSSGFTGVELRQKRSARRPSLWPSQPAGTWQAGFFAADSTGSQINRLSKIGDCPTIYIGSAGTYAGSKNTLHGRYRELATRHTAKYPVWALLSSRWELQYGWMIVDEHPGAAEEVLKKRYQEAHSGKLPALVIR